MLSITFGACNLNVYNLSAFTEQEIRTLVANRKGRLYARLYRRGDGTVLTQNCHVGGLMGEVLLIDPCSQPEERCPFDAAGSASIRPQAEAAVRERL